MLIGRIISPVSTLGPGRRVGVWTQGCTKKCAGCISPEFQPRDKTKDVPIGMLSELLISEARRNKCTGLTISGGDPFEQDKELNQLLVNIRPFFKDILVYTGFVYDEIKETPKEICLKYIDVLIDGRYLADRNRTNCVLRGSDNQKIIYINNAVKNSYEEYLKQGRKIETFIHRNKVIVVGIQERGKNDGESKST